MTDLDALRWLLAELAAEAMKQGVPLAMRDRINDLTPLINLVEKKRT